jgi:hypothetical protein
MYYSNLRRIMCPSQFNNIILQVYLFCIVIAAELYSLDFILSSYIYRGIFDP